MSELPTVLKAREFVKKAGIKQIPADIQQYLNVANAELSVKFDLKDSEAGRTIPLSDRYIIEVNGRHTPERQRFTVLHEIGHIILELPSSHSDEVSIESLHRYKSRPTEEIWCDVFAAECLLPYHFFREDVGKTDPGMDAIRGLAAKYEASLISTASSPSLPSSAVRFR
jgi:Zn-dependent peptidase ImmA (M78 family)